jgi:DNA replication protein DnaC
MYDFHSIHGAVRMQITSANLPMKTIGMELTDLDPSPAVDAASMWIESVRQGKVIQSIGESTCGLGLLLMGEPGHGKTMPRISWGNLEGNLRRPAYFSDYPRLLRLQKAQWSEDKTEENQMLIDSLHGEAGKEHNVRVFVLDDLGKEYRTSSGWAENTFDALLRARFNSGLPTIVTTNVPLRDWGMIYGEPMGSFAHESFIPIEVKSAKGDRRL